MIQTVKAEVVQKLVCEKLREHYTGFLSNTAFRAEVRLYDRLFQVLRPTKTS